MAEISDELLMAYADGALDAADRAAVETAIEAHPAYREKVEKFRATRAPIGAAFQRELVVGDLEPLIRRIGREGTRPAAHQGPLGAMPVSRGAAGGAHRHRLGRYVPMAMAASLALLAGGAAGWLLHSRAGGSSEGLVRFSDGGLKAQGPLQDLLERARSGISVVASTVDGQAWTLKTSFTFRSAAQSLCRRYEIGNPAAGRFVGYACRSGEGQWFVRAHASLRKGTPDSKGFVPAAGDGDGEVDAAIRSVMEGDVYLSKDEEALIANRWAGPRK